MRITEIREASIPLSGAISNSMVSFEHHRVSLVAVITDVIHAGRPLTGVAFNSIGRHSQGGILRERMIPRVLEADPDSLLDASGHIDPARVLTRSLTDEKPGGHGDRAAAASAIELACWDLLAKYHGEPAAHTIARRAGRTPEPQGVPVYAAGGYYKDGDDLTSLRDEILGYVDQGYPAVKIKIGGLPIRDDLKRLEVAIDAIGSAEKIAVDANGRFDRETALVYAQAIEPYQLRWYEEAGDPLDFSLSQELAAHYSGTIASGENLFSCQDVENLLRFGGARPDRDILQMDAGLSYGLTEYLGMIDLMERFGFSRTAAVPHGGHLINLHIVSGLNLGGCEAYPGVFHPFGGYSPTCQLADGRIRIDDAPGFGLEAKPGLREEISRLTA